MQHTCTVCGTISNQTRCPTHRRNPNATRNPNRDRWKQRKFANAVKARDNHRCTIEGCTTPTDRIVAHHIVPLAQGGTDSLSNGITVCWAHHRELDRYAT